MTNDLIALSAIGVAILLALWAGSAFFLLPARPCPVQDGRHYLWRPVWVLVRFIFCRHRVGGPFTPC